MTTEVTAEGRPVGCLTRLFRALYRVFIVAVGVFALVVLGFRWRAAEREQRPASELAPKPGRFVAAADVRIFVQEAGPPSGPVVLFVHGTGAWSETWREPMAALAKAGFRAIAIDLPPFGYSQRPEPPSYGKLQQGKRILGVLDALEIRRAIFVGHSFGGGPTMEAVLLAPHRARAVVLVDAALRLDAGKGASPLVKAVLTVPPVRDGLVATFLTNPAFTKRLLRSFIFDPKIATDARVAIYQKPLAVEGTTRAVGAWLPELLEPSIVSRSENPLSYAALNMPVLILWGEKDAITPLPQGRRLQEITPGSRLVVMNGVGHIPQIEDTLQFNELLIGFLSALPADQSAPPS